MVASAAKVLKRKPNIDLALAVCSLSLSLPSHAAFALFALGRTAGWIAHAAEQAQSEKLIRPRARYTGVLPTNANERQRTPANDSERRRTAACPLTFAVVHC
jgi:citrate synthase